MQNCSQTKLNLLRIQESYPRLQCLILASRRAQYTHTIQKDPQHQSISVINCPTMVLVNTSLIRGLAIFLLGMNLLIKRMKCKR